MNEPSASEHWFDRLATAMTRRTALKAGLAATAAMALPLSRFPRAAADVVHVDPCTNGCLRFAQQQQGRANAHCENSYQQNEAPGYGVDLLIFLSSPHGFILSHLANESQYKRCIDKALTASKVAQFDCIQPGCSGFDPKQPGGPCDTCQQNCCVCPGIPNGFICCIYACGDPDHNCCGS